MSGFGGYGGQMSNLQDQMAPPQQPGAGPGEPENMNYGQQGTYNTLAQDMSRNVYGPYGFGGGQFNYSPYGNPYAPVSPPPWAPPPQPPGMPPGGPDNPRYDNMRDAIRQSGGGLSGMVGGAFRYLGQERGRGPFADLYRYQGQQTQGIPGGGRPSWPGFGYGGMPGRYGTPSGAGAGGYMGGGYGGMYGGGGYGMSGGGFSRPWMGQGGAMPYGGGSGYWNSFNRYQPQRAMPGLQYTTGGAGKPAPQQLDQMATTQPVYMGGMAGGSPGGW